MENHPKIEFSKTNKGKMQLNVDNKYKYNLQIILKDGTSNFRCVIITKYSKCKAFLK